MILTKKQTSDLEARLSFLEQNSPRLATPMGRFPTKPTDHGDDMLWLGLLSTVGLGEAKQAVYHCQNPHTGQFYRSALRKLTDNEGFDWMFSRDMAIGVLLYYASSPASTHAGHSAEKWLEYMEEIRAVMCKVFGKKYYNPINGGYRYAKEKNGDKRSDVTPVMWALMGRVWRDKGWPLHKYMEKCKGADGDASVISAETVPLGFQLHLCACQAYLKMILGQSREYSSKVVTTCVLREPSNIFYRVLHYLVFEEVAALKALYASFMHHCPTHDNFKPRHYWLWEKSYVTKAIEEGKYCGWDWYLVGKMILNANAKSEDRFRIGV